MKKLCEGSTLDIDGWQWEEELDEIKTFKWATIFIEGKEPVRMAIKNGKISMLSGGISLSSKDFICEFSLGKGNFYKDYRSQSNIVYNYQSDVYLIQIGV